AEPGLEIPVVLLVDPADVSAHAEERRRERVEDDELVVALRRRDVPFVAESGVQRDVRGEPDVVLRKERYGILGDMTPPFPERDGKGIRRSRQERGHARKVELTAALGEVVVEESPVLAAKTQRVAADRAGDRVVEHVERVLPALRQDGGSAEVERAGDDHLG